MNLSVLLTGLLPSGKIKNALLRRQGFDVHSTAEVAPCFLLGVREMSLGPGSRIGTLTAIRGMRQVQLGAEARIGQLNWISSAPDLWISGGSGRLVLGAQSAITNRHYLDCSGGIEVGTHTTIAGVRSTFITHGIEWKRSEQSVAAIIVGSYCIISSNVNLTPGTVVPDRSVVGMGVTIDKNLGATGGLVVSARGEVVKSELNGDYFGRAKGIVKPPTERRDIRTSS